MHLCGALGTGKIAPACPPDCRLANGTGGEGCKSPTGGFPGYSSERAALPVCCPDELGPNVCQEGKRRASLTLLLPLILKNLLFILQSAYSEAVSELDAYFRLELLPPCGVLKTNVMKQLFSSSAATWQRWSLAGALATTLAGCAQKEDAAAPAASAATSATTATSTGRPAGECPPIGSWLGKNLPGIAGRVDGNGRSANVAQDNEGYLSYGPYATFRSPDGRGGFTGTAYFQLIIDNNTAFTDVPGGPLGTFYRVYDTVARIEVYDLTANQVLSSKTLRRNEFKRANAVEEFSLRASAVYDGHQMEFRVYWFDKAYIRVQKIELQPFTGFGFCK